MTAPFWAWLTRSASSARLRSVMSSMLTRTLLRRGSSGGNTMLRRISMRRPLRVCAGAVALKDAAPSARASNSSRNTARVSGRKTRSTEPSSSALSRASNSASVA